MTTTEKERLAVLEEQGKRNLEDHLTNRTEHATMIDGLVKVADKLDAALKTKADQTQFDDLNSRFWTFIMVFATAFIGLVVFLIQTHLGEK